MRGLSLGVVGTSRKPDERFATKGIARLGIAARLQRRRSDRDGVARDRPARDERNVAEAVVRRAPAGRHLRSCEPSRVSLSRLHPPAPRLRYGRAGGIAGRCQCDHCSASSTNRQNASRLGQEHECAG